MIRSRRERRTLIARSVMVLAAILLLPLAAMLQAPREGAAQTAAQDSLWAGSAYGAFAACADPTSPASLSECFASAASAWGASYNAASATDGVNVYFASLSDGGLSCPIADLGANCTRIMAGPWGGSSAFNSTSSLAAANGYLWVGQTNGDIYRCPVGLPWQKQATAPPQCVLLDDAGDRAVDSLLLANGTLYAGLGSYGTEEKKQGLLWTCSPDVANSCSTLDSYGNTAANALAAGGGYLWAGLGNGIVWRCDLNAANACADWEQGGSGGVNSLSYDGQGTLYAAIPDSPRDDNGVIWSCPTADADSCGDVLWNVDGIAVAAGPGSVFSSLYATSGYVLHYGTSPFTAASASAWYSSELLYLPADGPAGVGGVEVTISANPPGQQPATRCAGLGKKARATVTVEGPDGFAKTLKTGICGMKDGGSVTETIDLLDPGDYTVTVRAGKYAGEASFTVEQDRTQQVTVQLTRGLHH